MESRDFLYFVFMIASIIGICKYKLNKKSLLFVAFAGIQSYLYWDTDKINSFMNSSKSTSTATATTGASFMPGFDISTIFLILFMVIFAFFVFLLLCFGQNSFTQRRSCC